MTNPISYTQADLVGATPINTVDMEQLREELQAATFASTPVAFVNVASRATGGANFAIDVHFDTVPNATDEAAVDAIIAAHTAAGPTENDQVNVQTGTSYTLVPGDSGKRVYLDNAAAITLSVPTGLGANFICLLVQKGAGQVTVAQGGPGMVNNRQGHTKLAGQDAAASLVAEVADKLMLLGDTA